MDPRLLRHYKAELQFVQELAGEFAREYPKIAGRLGMDGFEVADPYVERLLEGFAFLTARVQLQLDSEFPRFTQHLLESVYPHYLAPLPSMVVAQFAPDLGEGELVKGIEVPRATALRSLLGKGDQTACEYRTAEAVTLWPLEVRDAGYAGSPRDLAAFQLPEVPGVRACVRLRLATAGKATWGALKALRSLPLFLQGPEELPMHLLEQLLGATVAVVVRPAQQPTAWKVVLEPSALAPIGFDDGEALLPRVPRGLQAYRLLQEYFGFPERFRGLRLSGLENVVARAGDARELDVFFLSARPDPRLEQNVDASRFALFCAAAINLFPRRCDRIHLEESAGDYHVVPDRSRPIDFEVHSLLEVVGHGTAAEEEQRFQPLYGVDDFAAPGSDRRFYTVERRPRRLPETQYGPRSRYVGSETFVTLVDGDLAPWDPTLKQLAVQALCTNRDLPLLMPLGQGQTDFTTELTLPVKSIRCVAGPTRPRGTAASGEVAWRLVSHLSLNYATLLDTDERQGAANLRTLLALYGDLAEPHVQKQVHGVRSVANRAVVRRLPFPGPLAFGRGLEVTLTCDESQFEGTGVYLLGCVLEHFFARYVSANSFTETVLRTVERGEIARWQPRTGTRHLL